MATDTDLHIRLVEKLLKQGTRSGQSGHPTQVRQAIEQHENLIVDLTKHLSSISGATSTNLHRLDIITNQLIQLKYLQNYRRAPISQIPAELLHHIFALLVEYYVDPYHLSNQSRTSEPFAPLGWLSITHVCHKWRQIMISDPQFWTQISPTPSPKWTQEMIARSLQLPIFVKIDCFEMTPDAYGVIPQIFDQSHRMQELSLIVPHIDTVLRQLVTPAANIQRFAIRIFRQLTAPTLPSNIFGGTTPLLRQVSLDGCQLHWESPLWDSLTHLKLSTVRLDMTLAQFMTVLSRMQDLKELSMDTAFPLNNRRFHLTEPIATAHLPKLTKLTLTQPSDFASILLQYVDCPTQPQVYLALHCQRPSSVAIGVILDNLYHMLTAPESIQYRCLIVEEFSERSMRIAGSKERDNRELHFVLRLSDNLYNLTPEDYALLSDRLIGKPEVKNHVKTLHLRGAKAGETIAKIYFPEVDMLVVDRAAALAWLSRASAADGGSTPNLKSIFFTEPLSANMEGVATSGSAVLEAMRGYLSLFNQQDFKLALVHLPEVDRHDPEIAALHELVWKISFSDIIIHAS